MMATKKGSYILFEIDWLESKIKELRDLVDSHSPFSDVQDRTETEVNAKGIPIVKLIAKKEDTIKMLKDILKDLPSMLESLNKLREQREAAKIEFRGGSTGNGMMQQTLEDT
jgi:hypothetical protein